MIGDEKKDDEITGSESEGRMENQNISPISDASPEALFAEKEARFTQELLYQRAEFDNYKKRILREQDSAIKFANERFVRELLPIVDLFDRATQTSESLKGKLDGNPVKNEINSFVIGVEMTQKELLQTLARIGVEFIGAKNEAFDPLRHEAISEVETPNGDEVGKVMQVAQRGCVFGGRLLKPAQVVVGRAKA